MKVAWISAVLCAAACSSDTKKSPAPNTDASTEGGTPRDVGYAGICAGMTGAVQLACGQYIVQHVNACGDCHSPRTATGIDMSKYLAGNPSFADIVPNDPAMGNIPTPNLTMLKQDGWTPAQVKEAILNGKDKDGNGLFPIMPYFTFHNMADPDVDAIVAYIFSLTPIANTIPKRQPLPIPAGALPIPPVDLAKIPAAVNPTDAAGAARGKYLAGQLGPCMECHTKHTPTGGLDDTKLFAGGEEFSGLLPSPPFPAVITSLNLTPHASGILGWNAQTVQSTIRTGITPGGVHLCPPMPFAAFAGMTDQDSLAIGEYLTHLPAIQNGPFPICIMPGTSGGDGGPRDAATGG